MTIHTRILDIFQLVLVKNVKEAERGSLVLQCCVFQSGKVVLGGPGSYYWQGDDRICG